MRRHQKKDMDAMRRGNAMRQWTAAGCRKKTTGKTYAWQECWSVENKLRWVLDVEFDEDHMRMRKQGGYDLSFPPETGHPTNLINFYLSGFNTYIQGIIGGSIQNGCPAGSIITRQRSSYWYSDKLAPHDKAYFTPSSTSWTWKSKCAICCCASSVAGHTGGT